MGGRPPVDPRGLFTYLSPVCEKVWGYPVGELVGKKHFYDLHPEEGRNSFREAAFSVFNRKASFRNLENRLVTGQAKLLWVSTDGLPMLSPDGTLLGYRGSDTDITANRKLKDQLLQAQKMEAVGQLAGGLAHDFSNVLSIINGYCALLKAGLQNDNRLTQYVEKILAASGRASELSQSMLAFSRSQPMTLEASNLNLIVSHLGSFVSRIIGGNINFSTNLANSPLAVYVDKGQIEQVLLNLVANSRDAMAEGGYLTVATSLVEMDDDFVSARGFGEAGSYAAFSVSDTGTGMDDAVKSRIFEPFFTTKQPEKGTGLGLAMVYGIVSQHNGFVEVSTAVGKGTSFVVYLPLIESITSSTSAEKTSAGELGAFGSESILVAEDDPLLREFLHELLVNMGYRVILAVDGQDLVEKLEQELGGIDLVILDMIMPRKGGVQAYQEIKERWPLTKILFCSGYSARFMEQKYSMNIDAACVSKPIQPHFLLSAVRDILDGRYLAQSEEAPSSVCFLRLSKPPRS